jgi:hypothetical protein
MRTKRQPCKPQPAGHQKILAIHPSVFNPVKDIKKRTGHVCPVREGCHERNSGSYIIE